MSSKKENIRSPLEQATAIVSLSSVVIILFIFCFFMYKRSINYTLPIDTEKFGHFGDIIGGLVGTILTFLATILLYYTYKSQKEGLKSQKEELELSRVLFSKQNFENTFFNMLNVHQELRKEIRFNTAKNAIFTNNLLTPDENINGKSFFEFAHSEFITLWKYESDDTSSESIFERLNDIYKKHKEFGYEYESEFIFNVESNKTKIVKKNVKDHLKDIIDLKYPIFWSFYANYLGDYFRNIYHILKFISTEKSREIKNNESEREGISEKYRKYADILQSQMSYSELFFMFYNAQKYTKVKPYIKEFDFVENLTIKNLLHPKHEKFEGMGKIRKE